jgi:hypothetical protein
MPLPWPRYLSLGRRIAYRAQAYMRAFSSHLLAVNGRRGCARGFSINLRNSPPEPVTKSSRSRHGVVFARHVSMPGERARKCGGHLQCLPGRSRDGGPSSTPRRPGSSPRPVRCTHTRYCCGVPRKRARSCRRSRTVRWREAARICGRDLSEWPFYLGLAQVKLAVIAEEIAHRAHAGADAGRDATGGRGRSGLDALGKR